MRQPTDSTYRRAVRQLQTFLYTASQVDPRIPSVNPDGIYGKTTAEAVAAFQRLEALPDDGRVDFATWQALLAAYRRALPHLTEPTRIAPFAEEKKDALLRCGDRSDTVRILRLMLSQLGTRYLPFAEVGEGEDFDETVEDAILRFQRIHNLPVTGAVDLLTWNRLAQAYNENTIRER